MSNAISNKILELVNNSKKEVNNCNSDFHKLSDSSSQISSLCTSVAQYLKNSVDGMLKIENDKEKLALILNSVNQLHDFANRYPKEMENSFVSVKIKKEAHASNLEKLEKLYSETLILEKEQDKIMEELEMGNSVSKKATKKRRKPGERPTSIKSERKTLQDVKDNDGEITLEDI